MSVESHRRNARAYQQRHRVAGLCTECPARAVNRQHCERHRQKHDIQQRARHRKLGTGLVKYDGPPKRIRRRARPLRRADRGQVKG